MKFENRRQVRDAAKQYAVDLTTAVLIVRRAQKDRITIQEAAKHYNLVTHHLENAERSGGSASAAATGSTAES